MVGDLAAPMLLSNLTAHEQLEAAARAVEALLPVLETPPIAPWPDNDPIRFIAGQAQKAWADANDGTSPHSKNPGDPLVKFVSKALSLVGMSRSPQTVSAVLRGRRRTKRADKIRN
jgi:Tfp pilus assembly protein PilP